MSTDRLTAQDLKQIKSHGLTKESVLHQIQAFKSMEFIELHEPCVPGNGILEIDEETQGTSFPGFQAALDAGRVIKFVPASGAATRMFQSLRILYYSYDQIDYRMLRSEDPQVEKNLSWFQEFIQEIKRFPFYPDLQTEMSKKGLEIENLLDKGEYKEILKTFLDPGGMNYANVAKGMMSFHRYRDECRTPIEEHMVEAIEYAKDREGTCRLHFAVADNQRDDIFRFIQKVKPKYEGFDIRFDIQLSVQDPSSDTITADLDNEIFRDEEGKLVFRPGGHGALLENLMSLDNDIIFIKNIDNVAHDRLKPLTCRYKKILGEVLIDLQQHCFKYLEKLSTCFDGESLTHEPDADSIQEMEGFCRKHLNIAFLPAEDMEERVRFLWNKLNRPLRVCGMVKKQDDRGGAPFRVRNRDGSYSLQIVEYSQVNKEDEKQVEIWEKSTHFNPVDIVCSFRDFKGNKFDLRKYANPDAWFISTKTKYGKPCRALEFPGLWNGSMAYWNTVFMEVPRETFTPVKYVMDLLKPEHQEM